MTSSSLQQPLDTRQLRTFVMLARTGSFTQAAKRLFLSQSAVSHSMRALEEDVGCRLVDRVGKRVALTQAGEELLHHAERMFNEMAVARAALGRLGKWGCSRVRIGASPTTCQHVLPGVVRVFREQFPQALVIIEPCDTAEAVTLIETNRIDLAVALEPPPRAPVEFHPLFQDEMRFLVSPRHPWATRGRAEQAEVPRQQYILYDKKSCTFRLIEEHFRRERMVLNTVMELGSMEAIKELVKLDLGISILAPWVAARELAEGSLVSLPLGRRKLRRHWGLLHGKHRRMSLVEETFLKLCRSCVPQDRVERENAESAAEGASSRERIGMAAPDEVFAAEGADPDGRVPPGRGMT